VKTAANTPSLVTAARLRELLSYDQSNGAFVWLSNMKGPRKAGETAGYLSSTTGYVFIKVDGVPYGAHRLAWLYVNGEHPAGHMDHMNRCRTDNRIVNLRVVTPAMNMQNRSVSKTRNSTGLLGVGPCKWKLGKWRARIRVNGVQRELGVFDTPEEAHEAYLSAKRILHPAYVAADRRLP
jgi:hypothetical protein